MLNGDQAAGGAKNRAGNRPGDELAIPCEAELASDVNALTSHLLDVIASAGGGSPLWFVCVRPSVRPTKGLDDRVGERPGKTFNEVVGKILSRWWLKTAQASVTRPVNFHGPSMRVCGHAFRAKTRS